MDPEDASSQKPFYKQHLKALWNAALLVVLFLYMLLGGMVFHFCEGEAETQRQQTAILKLQQLLENLTCISHRELQQLLTVANELSDAEVLRDTNESLTVQFPPGQWSLGWGIFFSMTVLTTIGYGNLTPKTPGGQQFCIFYALFGIPLLLLVLANIGSRIAKDNHLLTHKLFGSRLTEGSPKFCAAQFALLGLVGLVFFMLLPSVGFMYKQGWTYPESFYYTFITLSTIGFGDYIADLDRYPTGRMLFGFWILVGLAWFSALISTVQLMLSEKIVPSDPGCGLEDEQESPDNVQELDSISNKQNVQNTRVQYYF